MRVLIRTSPWAIWARRLGSLGLPLAVLSLLFHHLRWVDAATFLALVGLAAGVAGLALLIALVALVHLWVSGDEGWVPALRGLVLALVCLVPFAWYGSLALRLPPVTDIATTARDQLPLVLEPDTVAMPPPRLLTPDEQRRLYPNVATRSYPVDATQLFALVERIVTAQGWSVRLRIAPLDSGDTGRLNARIVTLPGFQEEVVLRVAPQGTGASVDMRSASIGAPHDFGANGSRISAFMVDLDTEVTAFLRDNPNLGGQPEIDSPEVSTGEVPAPAAE